MKRRSIVPSGFSSRLSHNGQLIGWAVFGGLVLVGFVFGVVVGYDSPRPIVSAKASKETPRPPETIEPKKGPAAKAAGAATPPTKMDEPPTKTEPPKVESTPEPRPAVSSALKQTDSSPKTDSTVKTVEPKPAALVSFQKQVLPILRAHCLNCHGAGTGKPKGNVNLTSIAAMRRSPGKILVPGKPEQSDVYTSVTERDMPDGGRPKPTSKELETLRNWILSGAKDRRRIAKRGASPG